MATLKTFVVLGMHRSGTSFIAESMHKNEIFMGEKLLPAAEDNVKGFYEDVEFLDLNNEILFEAKGNWLEPPSHEAILSVYPKFENKITKLINKRSQKFWGWKDPRTTLTIELFHKHLVNPHYIPIFRNPLDVANSLHKRNSCSIQKGMLCTKEYNFRLIKFLAKHHL